MSSSASSRCCETGQRCTITLPIRSSSSFLLIAACRLLFPGRVDKSDRCQIFTSCPANSGSPVIDPRSPVLCCLRKDKRRWYVQQICSLLHP